jgi:hypothetical protein
MSVSLTTNLPNRKFITLLSYVYSQEKAWVVCLGYYDVQETSLWSLPYNSEGWNKHQLLLSSAAIFLGKK